MKKLLAALMLLTTAAVQADLSSCCCDCGSFYAGVEALYWKSSHSPIPYAGGIIAGAEGTQVKADTIIGNGDWGVRGRVGYECDCLFADVSYLYFENKAKAHADGSGFTFYGIQGQPTSPPGISAPATEAWSHLTNEYQNVDLRIGSQLCCSDCGKLYLYGNARWANLCFSNKTVGETPAGDWEFKQASEYNAGGLGVGIGGNVPLYCGLGMHARSGITGLIGTSKIKNESVEGQVLQTPALPYPISLCPISKTVVVPNADFKVGLDYSWDCDCVSITGFVGYELNYLWNAIGFSGTPETGSNGLPDIAIESIGYSGLYFGVNLDF